MPKYLDYHGLETLTNDIDVAYVKKSQKGVANGVASLDNSGKVPSSQLPDLDALPSGGTAGQVLAKATDTDYDVEWVNQSGGGGGSGTTNYNDLSNKPQIGGITLTGNKTLSNLGIYNVPSGGTANQVLAKNSGTDYDLKWMTVSGGGSGSFTPNYVTPEDYGAVGNGTTDDTTAISQAFNSGKPVVLTKGKTYKITQIDLTHSLTLYGNDATISTTSIENAENVVPMVTVHNAAIEVAVRDVNFYTTADQTIYGAHQNDQAIPNRSVRSGFLCYGVSRMTFENCHFTNFDNPIRGTRASDDTNYTYIPQNTRIVNCKFDNVLMGILGFFKNVVVSGCEFNVDENARSGEHGIYFLIDATETAIVSDTTINTYHGTCGSCIQFYQSSTSITLPTLIKREYRVDNCILTGDSYISNRGGGQVYVSASTMKAPDYSLTNRRRQFECNSDDGSVIEVIGSTVNLELQDSVLTKLIFRECNVYSNVVINTERMSLYRAYNTQFDNIAFRLADNGEMINCTFSSTRGIVGVYYMTVPQTTTSSSVIGCVFNAGVGVTSIAYACVGSCSMIDIVSSLPTGSDNPGLTVYHKIDPTQSEPSGGGTTDYTNLTNKPSINSVTLSGNKTLSDLGIASVSSVSEKYTKPALGIPASDLASGVIPEVHNVPSGGTSGQVLAKRSATNYDLAWITPSGSSGGGTYSGLEGKNVIFFGDSISYGEGNNGHSYVDIIDEMGICASVVKEAHTSSCVGPYNVYSDGNGYDLISMIQLRSTDIANADVVFCAYGGNDCDSLSRNLIQLGIPEDISTMNTICGYTRRAIENIRAINPLVRIVWLFPRMCNFRFIHDMTSASYVTLDYLLPTVKSMAEVCADNNVTFAGQYDGLYLDKQSGHILNDLAGHPTELGQTLIAENVLHGYPFSVRPYEPVKHVTLNGDGTLSNATFAVLLLHVSHDIDVFIHYQGLVFRQKAYDSTMIVFEAESVASQSSSTRYILVITSSGTSLYTTTSSLTSIPWSGSDYATYYNGNITIRTDSTPTYFVIDNYTYPFAANETYRITWDTGATQYTCTTTQIDNQQVYDRYVIGNLKFINGDDSGEPFMIYRDSATRLVGIADHTAGTMPIKIEKYTASSGT